MRRSLLVLNILMLMLLGCQETQPKESLNEQKDSKEISFITSDGIKIIGDFYEQNKKGTTILLFHQGGSNARAEYGSIVPKLISRGYNVLAIDQRSGGQTYGQYNRTLANIPSNSFGDGYTYCDAYTNLEGALNYIIKLGYDGKKILWGSSYSASLAIKLAHEHLSDVDAVLAFSPASGGSMEACLPDQYFETLKVPLLLLRPPNEMENERAQNQFKKAAKYNHQTFVARYGVHGSSMLVQERVNNDVSANWDRVMSFLEEVK